MTFRSRHRADATHWPMLRALKRYTVAIDAHNGPLGFDILAVHTVTGDPVMIEAKRDAKAKLTPKELALSAVFPSHWRRCDTVAQALEAVGVVKSEAEAMLAAGR